MKLLLLLSALTLCVPACSPQDEAPLPRTERPGNPEGPESPESPIPPAANRMQITINGTLFSATLVDNAAAKAFRSRFPMSVAMGEMNGNEKYYYLPEALPMSSANPGTIQTGEIMLFGSDCLVLFYKTFPTSYSYTRIGHIDNPSGLSAAVGTGSVSVKFE